LTAGKWLTLPLPGSNLAVNMITPFTLRKELVEIGQRLYRRGMLAGTDGNLSVRLEDGRILVTPSGVAKGFMEPDAPLIVDGTGKVLQGNGHPSSELAMHLGVYRQRPDISACVHSHPPYATSFAVAGIPLGDDILPEVVLAVGPIPLIDYAPPGTDAVPKAIEPYLETGNAFLLRNHGLLTIGRSLLEAYHRHEVVEHYARIVSLARQLGRVDAIPSEDFQRLEKMRAKLDEVWNKKS
jgi:L-fuculose-phosphate aldolase